MNSSLHKPEKYLVFQIVKEVYGIKVDYIKEVFQTDKILKLPKTSDVLSGITELRGYILSVFDLSVLLWGTDFETERKLVNQSKNILVVSIKGQDIGILVDQVHHIARIKQISNANESQFKGKTLVDNSLISQIGLLVDQTEILIVNPEEALGTYFSSVKVPEREQEDTDDMDFDFSQYTLPDEGSENFMENMIEDEDFSE
jgi:purine-binding chemotaxis protein CheW